MLVSDEAPELEESWPFVSSLRMRGTYGIDSAGTLAVRDTVVAPSQTPVIWLRKDMLPAVQASGARLVTTLRVDRFSFPSVNVVGRVPGTDPARRNEYVLFSAHQDHDGVRHAVDGDSIFNGADDNASVSVGVLAIGRAVARRPMARSALFVWHGAEERGLLGSRWHASRPVVPRENIVAVLNADMIGRNHPDTAALMGVHPPHLNSRAMVSAAYRANAMTAKFVVDTTWDNPAHPEGWYFRSDHLPYARFGIPALYFSTLLHADYHTPRDSPERIDIAKLTRVAQWMYATGWIVGNAAERPDRVPGFKLER
jgi:Zn-dependent M28 family amino/carboxypeptidase